MAPELTQEASKAELFALLLRKKGINVRGAEGIPRRAGTGPAPLSFAQRRLWFLDRLQPGSSAYNLPLVLRFGEAFDPAALHGAVSEIVRRHESLRTIFGAEEGEPFQIVHPAAPVPLPLIDLSALPERERRSESLRVAEEERGRPFSLETGPLLRGCLLRLGAAGHTLLLTFHHIAADAWSLAVFRSELAALYAAFRSGEPSPLRVLPVQYADFAAWQRGRLRGDHLEKHLSYWRKQLQDLPPTLALPAPRPRHAAESSRGAAHKVELTTEVSEALRSLARREGATLFMVLLAALQALLARYSGQLDVCVGTPMAGRPAQTEEMIGLFLNTIALRTDLAGDPPFRELLARVREVTLEAQAHQEVPFELLLEELRPERDLGRTPFFQVLFNMPSAAARGSASPAAPANEGEDAGDLDEQRDAKLDLTVYAVESRGAISLQLHYRAEVFEAVQMERLGEHLRTLLGGVAEDPGRRLADLPLENAEERRLRTLRRNPVAVPAGLPGSDFPRQALDGSIGGRFAWAAREHADRPAVEDGRESWTYARLDRVSARAAARLAASLDGEARVGLLFPPGVERAAGLLAAMRAGRTCVPLDPSYPRARLAFLLADSGAGALLTGAACLGLAHELAAEAGGMPILELDPQDGEGGEGDGAFSPILPEVAPSTAAYILYTSGSTGQPKGVVQSHRNVLHHIRAYTNALRIAPSDRLSLVASYAFDAAVMDVFGALLNGAALCSFDVRGEGTEPLAGWLRRERITIWHSTPTLFRELAAGLPAEDRFPAVRLVVLGGEKCVRQDLEISRRHFPEALFVNGLGPTESTLALQYFATPGTVLERETVPAGFPVEETTVVLRNPAGEQLAPYGLGEIEIRSPYLALGYWRRPELTAAAFREDPEGGGRRIYRTGDLGRWLPDGSLEFAGRGDSQVKIRGHRVETGEVEAVLHRLPGVRQAVVVARESASGETRLIAYVLADPASPSPEARELRRALRERLPEPMIPSAFVRVERWPLTSTGKVDRAALPAPEEECANAANPASTTEDADGRPRTPVEELLCALWAEVLRRDRVGTGDDFFELGGHSLLATQLVARMRKVLHVEIPLRAVFEAPAVAAMAERVEELLRQGVPAALPLEPAPRESDPPASFAQQRLWFLDRLQPGSAAYNMPSALRLAGAVDDAALERALGEVVRRHETLRTTFADADGLPVQRIAPASPRPQPRVDLAALPPDRRRDEALRLAREEAERPFDLERGPVLRSTLLELEPEERFLLLTLHHVAGDGWSLGLLDRELWTLYDAFAAGRPSPLPELPVQYADYAVWQRRSLEGERIAPLLDHWRERLRGIPARLELPADRPQPAHTASRGGAHPAAIPGELAARLRGLALGEGSTLFMLLLAGFQAVLGRHAGVEDLCIGTPVAGRTRVEVEGLIGLFVNTLVLRGDLAGDPTFRELLRRARETALQAHAHQELPFERLVEELQPERRLGDSPLFQALLTLQNQPREPRSASGLRRRFLVQGTGTAKLDLSLTALEAPGELSLGWEYAADRFDRTTIARLAVHLETLLEAAAADPDLRLSALPLLSAGERHQILVEWRDTAAADPRDGRCLHELVLETARRAPAEVAAISGAASLTYGGLDRRSRSLAARLAGLGVGAGSFVPVLAEAGLDLPVAWLAVLRAGAAFVPLDPEWPVARLATVLAEGGSPAALVGRGIAPPEIPGLVWLPVEEGEAEESSAGLPPEAGHVSDLDPEQPIYAIYTSGSTGRPKGVVVPHRGLVNRFLWMDRFFGAAAARRVLQTTRPVYDSAVWQVFWPMLHGGATVLSQPGRNASPEDLAEVLERERITLADFVPSIFNLFVERVAGLDEPRRPLESLRAVIVGGEEMSAEAARTFRALAPEVTLVNLYGPTEASIGCIYHPVGESRGGRVPIGRPISNVHPLVLDRWDRPAPIGVPGELCLLGRCVGSGYLRNEEQTRKVFVERPDVEPAGGTMYRTGDLVRLLPDGALDFLGRIDGQVKIRGLRIEPGEIEAALREHPRVADAAVAVCRGPRLVAFVVAPGKGPGEEPAEAELRDFLRGRLPAPLVPAAVVFLPALPLTAGGKVDRRALELRAPDPAAPVAGSREAVRTPFQELLAAIWGEVLRIAPERIGGGDFFALGGHSLLATQVASRVRRAFGVDLPIRAHFEAPTLAGLARRIEAAVRSGEPSAAPPLRALPRLFPDTGELPLSFAQQRLWFLDRLSPEAGLYQLATTFLCAGPLDGAALDRALSEIVRRHEPLRTFFPMAAGSPVLAIAPPAPVPVPRIDLAALPEEVRRAEAARMVRTDLRRPFDLQRGPCFRATLLRLGAEEHALALAVHHIVSDGWSLGLLRRELETLYAAFSQGEPSPLPELPVQHADFAAWQRELLSGATLEREIAFWRRAMDGVPTVLDLPTDRPRPAVQTYRGGRRPFALSAAAEGPLAALARQAGSTPFMVLLAGFGALLHRATGQERIAVGTPISGRNLAEVEDLVGCFANTLVLPLAIDGALSFRALAERVREVALGAYAHQELPFEQLVEALNPKRDLSHNPLFQVLFGLHNLPPAGPGTAPRFRPAPLGSGAVSARFDLALDLIEEPDGVAGTLEYAADLFDAPTVERLSGHLRTLLEGVAADPQRRVADLPLLTAGERQQLLVEWNDSRGEEWPALPLHGLVARWAARTPDAVAVVSGEERLTYGELDRRARRLALRLRRAGVGPEVPVGICAERSAGLITGLLAILQAGGAYVPLDPAYPRQRLAWILEASKAPVVLAPARLAADLPENQARWIDLDVEEAAEEEEDREENGEKDAPPVTSPEPAGLAYVIFTSGSTGRPKGVAVSHGSAVHLLETACARFGFSPGDVWTVAHSFAFDFSVWEIWGALTQGGCLVVPPLDVIRAPRELADLLRRERVTVLHQTPSAARALAAALDGADPLPDLRLVGCGGEAFPRELAPLLLAWGAPVWNFYGPTEATVWAAAGPVAPGEAREGAVPLGRPLPDYRLHVLGPAGEPLPAGVPGELRIGGPGLARGYFGDPAQTAGRFVPDPFAAEPGERLYRTGDLVRRLPDGHLEFLGRLDHQVKVRGFRIELGEIEAALARHPGVREAVAVTTRATAGDATLAAWYVPAAASPPGVEELRRFLAAELPGYMVPALLTPLGELPLTPNGKVDRKALAGLTPAGPRTAAAAVPPRDEVEQRLLRIWEELLPAAPSGVTDDFFALGGHSMLAVRLMSRLEDELGQDLPVSVLFQAPTVESLASLLRQRVESALSGPLVRIQPGEEGRSPLFCVHPVGGTVLCYLPLARRLGPEVPVYGLQSAEAGTASLEEMAARYLEAVRALRPRGPYAIAGWSMGGLVAFEMARQLEEQGEQVELLVLIDPSPPRRTPADLPEEDLRAWFGRDLAGLLGREPEGRMPDLGPREADRLYERFRGNARAMLAYTPRPCAVRARLLLAGEGPDRLGQARLWERLATGGVEVLELPGDHYTALREPGVEELARRISPWLGGGGA